ncbi:MAG: hypothetical protein ACKV19_13170 [Verrucomicrobiales bacterium]
MNAPHDPSPELASLLRLKRYEQPPPGYFDDFAHAFHKRQRAELLRVSAWQLWVDRVGTHFMEWRFLLQPRWLVPLGATYAVLMLALFFRQDKPTSPGEVARARAAASMRPVGVIPMPGSADRPSLPSGAVPVSTHSPDPANPASNGLRRTPEDALVPVLPSTPDAPPPQAYHGKVIILVH